MTSEPTSTPLPLRGWTHTPESIPQGGLKMARVATADERKEIAAQLEILSLEAFSFDYAIKNVGGGTYRLTGRLAADVAQSCVVTLEPIASLIEETVEVEFQPDERAPRTAKVHEGDGEDEALDVDFESDVDIEPITDGRMDVGRIAFETFAAGLDPYPRKPGAAFDWKQSDDAKPGANNPFAALAKLKNKT